MSFPMAERPAASLRLPHELLEQILSYVPFEHAPDVRQLERNWNEDHVPRSFKPQLAFAHVCRDWRDAALASKYWPGVRLNLLDTAQFDEGIAHGHGDALLHIHIDLKHDGAMRTKYREWAPVLALKQIPRIRTLFIRLRGQYDNNMISDITAYAHAIESLAAPELQDFTCEWSSGGDRLRFDHMEKPCPRLRYLTLSWCNLSTLQTILHSENLVRINFRNVHMFSTIDELVDTVSRWKHLQCLNLSMCQIISPSGLAASSEHSAVDLPELKELFILDISANVAAFLKHVTFPPTTTVDLMFSGLDVAPEPVALQVRDSIHRHFDSPEGRSLISSAYGFTMAYPLAYCIQLRAPTTRKPDAPRVDLSADGHLVPQPDFSLTRGSFDRAFFEESLTAILSLETIPRLDLSARSIPIRIPPPTILRRFAGTTHLALNKKCLRLLDDIPNDAQLFSQLACIELVGIAMLDKNREATILQSLQNARDARPSLVRLLLRECTIRKETFADTVFGEGNVEIVDPGPSQC
ncbi:unnamed protein product [Peniophora sp. CBMAI 1063]|nr:unnamed protein product [Peniophora sp. CBMAI 1063]